MPEPVTTTECVGTMARTSEPELLPNSRNAEGAQQDVWCRTDYYCLAGLCGLVFLVYAQLWLPGLVLIKRDAFQFFLPIKQYIIDRLSAGELPQWFPYEGLGRPLLGIPVTGVFHPFTALYWLFPVHDAYRVSTLLSCLTGALGAYVLGRVIRFSPTGALVSAVGFSCSGYVMSLTENLVYLYSTCVLPLFLVALEKSCATRKSSYVAISALVWGSVFLNGDVQTGYYFGFVALVWVAMRDTGSRLREAALLVPIVVLTILLAGIQLAPAWAVFERSDRTLSDLFHAEAIHWSTHPLRLMTLILSPIGDGAEGDQIAYSVFGNGGAGRGPAGFWAESLYLGLPIIGLAVAGAWRSRNLLVFTVIGGVSLVLALGQYGGLYNVFYQWLPLWSAFRYPEKLMGIATLALAMLAGGGIEKILNRRCASWPWFGVGLLCLGLSAILYAQDSVYKLSDLFRVSQNLAASIAISGVHAALLSAAAASGVGALILWIRVQPSRWPWASAALIFLIAFDLARGNLSTLQTAPSEAWTSTPGLVQAIKDDAKVEGPGHFRILGIKDSLAAVPEHVDRKLTARERIGFIRRHGLFVEHNAPFKIESVQNYLPGRTLLTQQIGRSANIRTVARFNVAYLIGRPARFDSGSFAGSVIATVPDFDLALVRNPVPVTPRVYLSRRPEAPSHSVPIVSFIEREDFLNGEVDLIEGVPGQLPEPLTHGQASLLEYGTESIRISVETAQPAVLVLVDAFEPGWQAEIEGGVSLPIFRANGLVRAIVVPAGKFTVRFTYETPLLRVGAYLSLVGVVICIWLFLMRKSEKGCIQVAN